MTRLDQSPACIESWCQAACPTNGPRHPNVHVRIPGIKTTESAEWRSNRARCTDIPPHGRWGTVLRAKSGCYFERKEETSSRYFPFLSRRVFPNSPSSLMYLKPDCQSHE